MYLLVHFSYSNMMGLDIAYFWDISICVFFSFMGHTSTRNAYTCSDGQHCCCRFGCIFNPEKDSCSACSDPHQWWEASGWKFQHGQFLMFLLEIPISVWKWKIPTHVWWWNWTWVILVLYTAMSLLSFPVVKPATERSNRWRLVDIYCPAMGLAVVTLWNTLKYHEIPMFSWNYKST